MIFTIKKIDVTDGYAIGDKNEAVFTFGAIISSGGTMTLEAKGLQTNYDNMVYVDFSSNTQIMYDRTGWNLGFYCGNDYRVVLNAAYGTTAVSSGKTDIREITLEDAQNAPNLNASMGTLSWDMVDYLDGDLNQTAWSPISDDPARNPVYFVGSDHNKASRGDWYKVKVDRSSDGGYIVQYGTVDNRDEIKTVTVNKLSKFNLVGLSLETGTVTEAEPEIRKWDILYSYGIGEYIMAGNSIPMFMQDFVAINHLGGVQAAEVNSQEIPYAAFGRSHISSLDFSANRNVIGSNWRNTMNAGGIYTDLYYVVKDPAGNYYKLKFITMGVGSDGGERGRPEIAYELVE